MKGETINHRFEVNEFFLNVCLKGNLILTPSTPSIFPDKNFVIISAVRIFQFDHNNYWEIILFFLLLPKSSGELERTPFRPPFFLTRA